MNAAEYNAMKKRKMQGAQAPAITPAASSQTYQSKYEVGPMSKEPNMSYGAPANMSVGQPAVTPAPIAQPKQVPKPVPPAPVKPAPVTPAPAPAPAPVQTEPVKSSEEIMRDNYMSQLRQAIEEGLKTDTRNRYVGEALGNLADTGPQYSASGQIYDSQMQGLSNNQKYAEQQLGVANALRSDTARNTAANYGGQGGTGAWISGGDVFTTGAADRITGDVRDLADKYAQQRSEVAAGRTARDSAINQAYSEARNAALNSANTGYNQYLQNLNTAATGLMNTFVKPQTADAATTKAEAATTTAKAKADSVDVMRKKMEQGNIQYIKGGPNQKSGYFDLTTKTWVNIPEAYVYKAAGSGAGSKPINWTVGNINQAPKEIQDAFWKDLEKQQDMVQSIQQKYGGSSGQITGSQAAGAIAAMVNTGRFNVLQAEEELKRLNAEYGNK